MMTSTTLARLWRGLLVVFVLVGFVPHGAAAGGAWSLPVNLSQSAADSQSPTLAVDASGRTHVVWNDGAQLKHRILQGATWSPAADLGIGNAPVLLADASGSVHLTYEADPPVEDVYYVRWTAANGWGAAVNVSESISPSLEPALALHPTEGLALVWTEATATGTQLYLGRSTNGSVWSAAPVPNAHGDRPSVIYEANGRLVVAWEEPFDEGLPYEVMVSERSGVDWTLPVDVSFTPTEDSLQPALLADPGGTVLAWIEDGDVVVSRKGAGGWGDVETVSSGDALALAAAGDGAGLVDLAWLEGSAVWHRRWNLSQGSFGQVGPVAQGLSALQAVALAQGGGRLPIAWSAQGPSNHDIFYSTMVDAGGDYELSLPLVMRYATH